MHDFEITKDERRRLLDGLELGGTYTGTVSAIRDFGVFVDLGGIRGMINVTQLSWRRFEHPGEIVSLGQEVTVQVLDIDFTRERISLSLKVFQKDPWLRFPCQVGDTLVGTVTKIVPFGAFVHVADGAEGLVHASSLGDLVVEVGDQIRVRLDKIDVDPRRIALSRVVCGPG